MAVLAQPQTAGGPAQGQSVFFFSGFANLNAANAVVFLRQANSTQTTPQTPAGSVASGKTFYITDLYVSGNSSSQFQVQIQADAAGNGVFTDIFDGYAKGDTGPIQLIGIETQPSASAGSQVRFIFAQTATTIASYFISGFEQ